MSILTGRSGPTCMGNHPKLRRPQEISRSEAMQFRPVSPDTYLDITCDWWGDEEEEECSQRAEYQIEWEEPAAWWIHACSRHVGLLCEPRVVNSVFEIDKGSNVYDWAQREALAVRS